MKIHRKFQVPKMEVLYHKAVLGGGDSIIRLFGDNTNYCIYTLVFIF